jgi:branched-chain amino acid transport system ATP-binding protein
MSALLSAEKLQAFYGASQILHGIDLSVVPGETVALMGRNGMGKTTLLRSLIGLVADRRGRILLQSRDITKATPETIARGGVAFVPEGRGIFASLSVVENLIMAARPGRDGQRRWTLETVFALFPRLAERRRQCAGTLSGGERQMLAIGRALMSSPGMLLLDEPSLGLAPVVVESLYEALAQLHRQGMTMLLAEQSVALALELAGYAYVLQTGRTVLAGPAAKLATDPEVRRIYLGL